MQEEQKVPTGNDDKRSAPIPAPRKLSKKRGSEKLRISAPYDFRHVAHLGLNSGPNDLSNLSKIDEIDSHLREKDALQNLEAAAAGLHVPSWSSEVLCDKHAQNDDMSEIKSSTATPAHNDHWSDSITIVESPSEKHVPSSKVAQKEERSSLSMEESAKSSTHDTEESTKRSSQHIEEATTHPEQENTETFPQGTQESQKSSIQRINKPKESSVYHKEGPSLSYLNRTKELAEIRSQQTESLQKPSSSKNNEKVENINRDMSVPVSKKKSKAPPPPVEVGGSKSDISNNGEVQEVETPIKSLSPTDEKKDQVNESKEETVQSPVPSSNKVEESSATRKRDNTAPSSSSTPNVRANPAVPHPPHQSTEEKEKQSLPPWMTEMAAKDQKRFCEVWVKALDRSDRLHSSRNVMEKVAKFEASSSFCSPRPPTRFRKMAPVPPERQEVLKKCVELDELPPIREIRRAVSQPLSNSTAGKANKLALTTKEKSGPNEDKPVPKPRMKKSNAPTETSSAQRDSDEKLAQKTPITSKQLSRKSDAGEKMGTVTLQEFEDSDEEAATIRL